MESTNVANNNAELIKQVNQLLAVKEFRQGAKLCFNVLRQDKTNTDILNVLIFCIFQLKKPKTAYRLLKILNQRAPNNIKYLTNQAVILLSIGFYDEAVDTYEKILTIDPNMLSTIVSLADLYQSKGEHALAIKHYKNALGLEPDNIIVLFNLANALVSAKSYNEAVQLYERVATINPTLSSAYINLAVCMNSMGDPIKAVKYLEKAIQIEPNNIVIYTTFSGFYSDNGDYENALLWMDKALALEPQNIVNIDKRGQILRKMGRFDEALAEFNRVVGLNPHYVQVHFNLAALHLLLAKQFKKGWEEYDWRIQFTKNQYLKNKLKLPLWKGESLKNKKLLVFSEQGFGDVIFFSRYLQLIKKEKGKVLFELERHPALLSLMRTLTNVDKVVDEANVTQDADYCIPVGSLPKIFGTTLETIPRNVPYLKAKRGNVKKLEKYFQPYKKQFKVGICWQGSKTNAYFNLRSCSFTHFRELMSIPNIQFYNLQKDAALPENTTTTLPLIDLAPVLMNFADTAAAINGLDLVITIDTSVAHLAGALNKPVWTLLSTVPDWRWMLDRTDSPWYPSMRLYRQSIRNNWDDVFARIKVDLQKLVQK